MNTERIKSVIHTLRENNQKVTVSNVVIASLFSVGGTLAHCKEEIKQVIKDSAEKRKFLCVWGDWEKGAHSYQNTIAKNNIYFFNADHGYDINERLFIEALQVGDTYRVETGNHIITRIK